MTDNFPAEYARTLNYTLGAPRTFQVSRNGRRVFYLRAPSPNERRLDLWSAEPDDRNPSPSESLIAAVADLPANPADTPRDPEAERLRKERLREASSGITSYSIDDTGSLVAFAIGGDVYVKRIGKPDTLFLQTGDASNVTLSPDGRMVAYVAQRELHVAPISDLAIEQPVRISPPATETVSWGLPEFVAAEEMQRHEGYWWAPDSKSMLFARVDEAPVQVWHISNPADPASAPHAIRYPAAGSANADVSLFWWSAGASLTEITWDKGDFPYLVAVKWSGNNPTLVVQDRSQRLVAVLSVDAATGQTRAVCRKSDPAWIDLTPGVPTWSRDGALVDVTTGETRTLLLAGREISKPGLQVRKFVGEAGSGRFIYTASDDAKATHVWSFDGIEHIQLSQEEGVFDAAAGDGTVAMFGTVLGDFPLRAEIVKLASGERVALANHAARVSISPRPLFRRSDANRVNYALLLPRQMPAGRKLPILMNPYGGPGVQRCVMSSLSFTTSQWFADQGFAVVVADGRGTPGRGREWEKAIANDLIHPILGDQVEVLDHVIATNAWADPTRVAIRGWSFGGYLSACAAILRPDKFHAAIAGAPVTDWRFYDTHYTERYLGLPQENEGAYTACSPVHSASSLTRPLLLIHGLSDDNVVSAHTLRLSQALFETGRTHNVLPLTGITHMAASETAAENLLHAQLSFLRKELGML